MQRIVEGDVITATKHTSQRTVANNVTTATTKDTSRKIAANSKQFEKEELHLSTTQKRSWVTSNKWKTKIAAESWTNYSLEPTGKPHPFMTKDHPQLATTK